MVVEWWSVVHGVVVEWWSVVEGCLVEVQLTAGDVVSRPLDDDHAAAAAAAVIFTARTQHFHRRDAIAVALCLSVCLSVCLTRRLRTFRHSIWIIINAVTGRNSTFICQWFLSY